MKEIKAELSKWRNSAVVTQGNQFLGYRIEFKHWIDQIGEQLLPYCVTGELPRSAQDAISKAQSLVRRNSDDYFPAALDNLQRAIDIVEHTGPMLNRASTKAFVDICRRKNEDPSQILNQFMDDYVEAKMNDE